MENAASLIEKEADGRTFRLIGVGVSELGPASEADPADLFSCPDVRASRDWR
jgi:DNA polymerase-4